LKNNQKTKNVDKSNILNLFTFKTQKKPLTNPKFHFDFLIFI